MINKLNLKSNFFNFAMMQVLDQQKIEELEPQNVQFNSKISSLEKMLQQNFKENKNQSRFFQQKIFQENLNFDPRISSLVFFENLMESKYNESQIKMYILEDLLESLKSTLIGLRQFLELLQSANQIKAAAQGIKFYNFSDKINKINEYVTEINSILVTQMDISGKESEKIQEQIEKIGFDKNDIFYPKLWTMNFNPNIIQAGFAFVTNTLDNLITHRKFSEEIQFLQLFEQAKKIHEKYEENTTYLYQEEDQETQNLFNAYGNFNYIQNFYRNFNYIQNFYRNEDSIFDRNEDSIIIKKYTKKLITDKKIENSYNVFGSLCHSSNFLINYIKYLFKIIFFLKNENSQYFGENPNIEIE